MSSRSDDAADRPLSTQPFGKFVVLMHKQHKLAQHHRHDDVGASPFGSREIPGSKRALQQHHVFRFPAARLNPSD